MQINNIPEFIAYLEKNNKNPMLLNDLDKAGHWKSVSAQEMIRQVRGISAALRNMGLKKGAKVAIMSPPSSTWTIADLGIMLGGYVCVPIFPNISDDNFKFEITQSEIEVIFVAKPLGHHLANLYKDSFRHIVSMESPSFHKHELLFKDLVEQQSTDPEEPVSSDDLATIIYTSGTTNVPKGVELTHGNLTCEFELSLKRVEWTEQDKMLLFLPLSHIFGRLVNFLMLMANGSTYYLQDVQQLIPLSKEVQPTTIIFVPRLLEKMYHSIEQKIEGAAPLKKYFGRWAFNLAKKEKFSWFDRLLFPLADTFFYSRIRELLGGKVTLGMIGSAKTDPTILYFFENVGVPMVEGYGLTEACPITSNAIKEAKLGTMGVPMDNLEVKIDSSGELLVKGPVVMRGYHKNPEMTKQIFDQEGWLRTGDICMKDEKGFYTFIGRASELCKTSYGEFIDLAQLESALRGLPFVDCAVVLAENRPFATALLFPNIEEVNRIKERLGMSEMSNNEVLQLEFVRKEFDRALEKLNARLNEWERIKGYRFVTNAATVEGGELSPTYKMRRKYTHDKYKSLIQEMYPANTMVFDL